MEYCLQEYDTAWICVQLLAFQRSWLSLSSGKYSWTTLNVEAASSTKMSVTNYETTCHHMLEDFKCYQQCCENLIPNKLHPLYIPGETLSLMSVMHTSRWRPCPSGVEPAKLMLHGSRICKKQCVLKVQFSFVLEAAHNEDAWGSDGIAPSILQLDTNGYNPWLSNG